IKNEVATLTAAGKEVMLVGIGDKIRGILSRTHSDQFLVTFKDVGRKPPTFGDASVIALEFLANIIYYSLKESTTSEQSARMTAMDNASKNASEMIDKLTLTFNRTRQAVITKELIEIISGA
ncbi:ATP synthase subunit gamma, mitochondrial-like, partial [Octodon degus]|uniref:ATP synthase subunit gamma, mitochondrial-like n=1 Tax=Octodon degus TaxID=10160 RepID=A0A6P3V984_OCTDE